MSEDSPGEGWWVASDGKWYAADLHPEFRQAPPSETPVVQGATSSDSAEEPSTDRSAVAVATARKCVNGHEVPESSIFCAVCGSEQSEVPQDFSAPASDKPQGWMGKRSLAVIVAVVVLAGAGLVLGFSDRGSSPSKSASSNTPSTSAPVSSPTQNYLTQLSALNNADINATSVNLLLGLGNGVCTELQASDGGIGSVEANADIMVETGEYDLTISDMGYIEGSAVKNLCPQWQTTVEAQLQEGSS